MSSYQDSVSEFYQISGFQAHSNGWFKRFDDKPMIDALLRTNSRLLRPGGPDTPIELILGILESGASYILMTRDQTYEFIRKHDLETPTRRPWKATQFISLSPFYLHSRNELEKKVASYKQRPRNKNRRDNEVPQDNSQANRGYVKTGSGVVHYRGYFEQQRTLYRLLKKDLRPSKVGMAVPPWLDGVRVVSLVFGVWAADDRAREARLDEPRFVDAGWTETSFPSFFEQLAGSTVHLNLSGGLRNPNPKTPLVSEVCKADQAGLYSQLRSLLESGNPVILLVHDEDMTRRILSRADIDVSAWSSGLSNLLASAPVRTSTSGRIIVDTQKLVRAVMATTYPGRTVPESAKVLRMQKDTQTCSGDDSLLQLRMWVSMAEGLAIDEQHAMRESLQPPCAQVLGPPEREGIERADAEVNPDDMDTNDMDTNDVLPVHRSAGPIDFSDEDDW